MFNIWLFIWALLQENYDRFWSRLLFFAIKCLLKVCECRLDRLSVSWLLSGLDFNLHYEFSILVSVATAESNAGSCSRNTFDSDDLNDC